MGWFFNDAPKPLCTICKVLAPLNMDISKDLCLPCAQKYVVEGKPLPKEDKKHCDNCICSKE